MNFIVTKSILIATGISLSACNVTTSRIISGENNSDNTPTFIAAPGATVTIASATHTAGDPQPLTSNKANTNYDDDDQGQSTPVATRTDEDRQKATSNGQPGKGGAAVEQAAEEPIGNNQNTAKDFDKDVESISHDKEADMPLPITTDPGKEADMPLPITTDPGKEAELPLPITTDPGKEAELPLPITTDPGKEADKDGPNEVTGPISDLSGGPSKDGPNAVSSAAPVSPDKDAAPASPDKDAAPVSPDKDAAPVSPDKD